MGHDEDYTDTQLMFNRCVEQGVRQALENLGEGIGPEPRILDAGTGPGGNLELFNQVFDDPEVTALDYSGSHLESAKERQPEKMDVDFTEQDLNTDTDLDSEYDLIWISDVLLPDSIEDPVYSLEQLRDHLKEEGEVAVYFNNWLRSSYLPGHPQLESKILSHITESFEDSWKGAKNPERSQKWVEEAGFSNVRKSFYQNIHEDPWSESMEYVRNAVEQGLYQDTVESLNEEDLISEEEYRLWENITDENHDKYIFDQEDYHCRINSIMVKGEK